MLKWYCFIVLYHINSVYKILCMYIQNNNINIITHNFSTLNSLRIFFFFFTVLRFFSLRVHLTRECTDTLLCFKSLETALLYEFRPTNLYQIKIFFSLFYRNLIFSLFYYLSVGIKFIQRSLASIPTPFSCVYSSMLHFEILYDCYEDALI